jgi:3-(3-hydroxy-phenyl)propionate hydroxylase
MASTSQEQIKTDVVIIGFGPVGAMLANLLGLQGIGTLVLEREAAIHNLPRAVHFDDEVMRLLQTVDLAQAMQPFVHVSPGMKFVDDIGRLLLDWPRPQHVGQQGWHASYRFHQPELERVLREGLARWPSVTVRLRTEAFALEQGRDAVVVRYEDQLARADEVIE